jgi:hypothetical protein
MNFSPKPHNWGAAPWQIDFTPGYDQALPDVLDLAVIGGIHRIGGCCVASKDCA